VASLLGGGLCVGRWRTAMNRAHLCSSTRAIGGGGGATNRGDRSGLSLPFCAAPWCAASPWGPHSTALSGPEGFPQLLWEAARGTAGRSPGTPLCTPATRVRPPPRSPRSRARSSCGPGASSSRRDDRFRRQTCSKARLGYSWVRRMRNAPKPSRGRTPLFFSWPRFAPERAARPRSGKGPKDFPAPCLQDLLQRCAAPGGKMTRQVMTIHAPRVWSFRLMFLVPTGPQPSAAGERPLLRWNRPGPRPERGGEV